MIVATWTQFQAVWFDCNQQDMGGLPWVFAMSYHVLPIWINQQHVIFSSKKMVSPNKGSDLDMKTWQLDRENVGKPPG